ncbi:DinB family protein [Fibrella sp. HMF5335]|uniref:DinB family protein n=1 Tax=Fibrella rubiginis TaxID=2817060 RepID=A0A939GGD2_9BACT|nr:DinB family protein [Fibrella rubiginis]MBO0938509.1 DinB family protein [Fibrella rubiginis]
MTTTDPKTSLLGQLHLITDWLNDITLEATWTAPQGEKWTIEQEFAHLLKSTYGIVQLFGEPARAGWRPTDRPSRSYDQVVTEYKAALPLLPPGTNPVPPGDPKLLTQQRAAWQQTVADVEATLQGVTPDELTGNTVWKHPLIGPLTGLEMIFFSDYHTGHHLASLQRKQQSAG